MFWENEYRPDILGCELPDDCELSDGELQHFLDEQGIELQIVDNSTRWCAFAQYYAYNLGFDVIKATSFSYMVSLFMTGMGVAAGTEMYFKEEQIELDLVDRLNEIKSENLSEERKVRKMFNYIYWTYRNHISDYEYATERLSFKLTPSEMQKFQSINGKNNKEKFKNLIGSNKMFSVKDSEYKSELVKLGFSERLLCSPESCERWVEHCKKYNMKFLKGSYGTMVHKNFNKYFKEAKSNKIKEQLMCKYDDEVKIDSLFDHTMLFKSKIEKDAYILTSSPYAYLNENIFNQIRNYPYDIYVIHPNFLDYSAFVDNNPVGALRSPLSNINYAFTNASPEQILNINTVIYDELETFVFQFLSSKVSADL